MANLTLGKIKNRFWLNKSRKAREVIRLKKRWKKKKNRRKIPSLVMVAKKEGLINSIKYFR